VRLTRPQLLELRQQKLDGPQPTFGSPRTRVQNRLVSLGLSTYQYEHEIPASCTITQAGLDALTEATRRTP